MLIKIHRLVPAAIAFTIANGVAAEAPADRTGSGDTPAEATERTTTFFFAVRPWASRWDVPLNDAQVIIPNPLVPSPVLRTFAVSAQSGTSLVPLTAVGIRHGNFVATLNLSPSTDYSTGGLTTRDVNRRELDFSLGYSMLPHLVGALVYKSAKVDQVFTKNFENLLGTSGGVEISALLVGLSASAPLQGRLSLYGNVAAGVARQRGEVPDNAGKVKWNGAYTIGELGLSYGLVEGGKESLLKNLTLQVGYRAQLYTVRNITYGSLSLPGGELLTTETRDADSTTGGFLIGLVGVF